MDSYQKSLDTIKRYEDGIKARDEFQKQAKNYNENSFISNAMKKEDVDTLGKLFSRLTDEKTRLQDKMNTGLEMVDADGFMSKSYAEAQQKNIARLQKIDQMLASIESVMDRVQERKKKEEELEQKRVNDLSDARYEYGESRFLTKILKGDMPDIADSFNQFGVKLDEYGKAMDSATTAQEFNKAASRYNMLEGGFENMVNGMLGGLQNEMTRLMFSPVSSLAAIGGNMGENSDSTAEDINKKVQTVIDKLNAIISGVNNIGIDSGITL